MSTITIYGFAGSTYVRTVRMACEERGVEHSLQPVDYGSDSHGEVHPYRRMPAMQHDGVRLFEALAIASYVDEIGDPGPSLWPDDVVGRARTMQWISATNGYVYPGVVRALVKLEGEPAEETVAAARRQLEPFDAALRGDDWLAGDSLSLADLFLAPIDSYGEAKLGPSGALDGLEGLAGWRERVRERPSFAATAPS